MNFGPKFKKFIRLNHAPDSFRLDRLDKPVYCGRFKGSHVVVGSLPLKGLLFRPEDDEIMAPFRKVKASPESCPRVDELQASPENPPIGGFEERQHLNIACSSLRSVVGPDRETGIRVIAYPICELKAGALGLDTTSLPDEYVLDIKKQEPISCPFSYLGGAATSAWTKASAAVAVDAVNPAQTTRLETVPPGLT